MPTPSNGKQLKPLQSCNDQSQITHTGHLKTTSKYYLPLPSLNRYLCALFKWNTKQHSQIIHTNHKISTKVYFKVTVIYSHICTKSSVHHSRQLPHHVRVISTTSSQKGMYNEHNLPHTHTVQKHKRSRVISLLAYLSVSFFVLRPEMPCR